MKQVGLKIALVTTFYPPFSFGGDGNYVRQQALALARRGHQVDVLHNIDAYTMLSGGLSPEPIVEPEGITVTGLRTVLPKAACIASHQSGNPSFFYHRKVTAFFAARNYDVIHYHNVSLVGGPGILAYGNGIKIYTAHEHWLVCPTHILWRYNREPCMERQCLRCTINYRRPPQLWRKTGWLEKCASHIDTFCALSEFSAKKHQEYGFKSEMTVMPSFLPDSPVEPGSPDQVAHERKRPYFLFVGRLEKIKGAQDLIPAFLEDQGADLVVVGTGSIEDELKQLAGDSPYIRFTGLLNQNELKPLYQGAHAVVLPSLCFEVFPLVALEAFREGTPIIAHELGPFPEIIRSSQGGLLYKDAQGLQKAIQTLLLQPDLRDHYASESNKRYTELWSEVESFSVYFSLLKKLARKHQRVETLKILNACSDDGKLKAQSVSAPTVRLDDATGAGL